LRSTIKDVAKRAGISTTTVSLALNDPHSSISERTRKLVAQAAKELNYRPNRLAVSLVTKKTNTIGLLIANNRNTLQAAFSSQIESAAVQNGYSIIFGTTHESVGSTIHHLYDFSDRGVDGIIMTQSIFDDPEDTEMCLKAIEELRVPVVLTDRVHTESTKDMVILNDFKGGYEAVKYLLDIGHRKIGLVTGSMKVINCVKRMNGCKKAFEEACVPFDNSNVYEGNFSFSSGIEALPYLLGKTVTAVFTFNDMMAYGIYKAAVNFNINIPDDLSVVGFDDIFFSDIIYPPLTTIEFPIRDMASAVIKLLVKQIEDSQNPAQIISFDPILKVRASTKKITVQDV